MRIWVDADACPVVIREILYRAAERCKVLTTLVANRHLQIPASPYIEFRKVFSGFDVADEKIGDIPLASEVIDKGGFALSPRGEMFSPDTIKSLLNMRDFMDTMRGSGINTGGPPPLNQNDRKMFADNLDRILAKHLANE